MARKLANTPKPAQAPAGEGHNSKALEEAERVQLISIVSKLSAADDAIEVARGPLKAAQADRRKIVGLGKAAGFAAWELEARLAEMKRGAREMAEIESREHKHRRWLGILDDQQTELMLGDKVPPEAKDEAHWAGEGLKAGLRQMSSTPPPECPQVHVQAFMKAHERGLKEVISANVPGKERLSVREQAAADFAADNPEPGSPEAKKAERESIRRAKESLEAMQAEHIAAAQEASRKLAEENPPFEMTEEERAAQQGRPSNEDEAVV